MTKTQVLIDKLTAAEKATDAIGHILTTLTMAGVASVILCSGASAKPVKTVTVTKPNYELSCEMTQPGRSFIRVAGQVEQRRYSSREVCSLFQNGTVSESVRQEL